MKRRGIVDEWKETGKTHAPLSFLFSDRSGAQTELTLFEKPTRSGPVTVGLRGCPTDAV